MPAVEYSVFVRYFNSLLPPAYILVAASPRAPRKVPLVAVHAARSSSPNLRHSRDSSHRYCRGRSAGASTVGVCVSATRPFQFPSFSRHVHEPLGDIFWPSTRLCIQSEKNKLNARKNEKSEDPAHVNLCTSICVPAYSICTLADEDNSKHGD
jgi:hypothetical protein